MCSMLVTILTRKLDGGWPSRLKNKTRARSTSATVDSDEIHKFNLHSANWWSIDGEFKPLHAMNGLRVLLIRDGILDTLTNVTHRPKPLSELKLLDVGCGGGILSEPLARLGANVTGLDASPEMIAVAKHHAQLDRALSSNFKFHLLVLGGPFVHEYGTIRRGDRIGSCGSRQRFTSVCRRVRQTDQKKRLVIFHDDLLSWFLVIFMAENVLNVVPRGTHSYDKLVPPQELERLLKDRGCRLNLIHGTCYNPIANSWHRVGCTDICYALHAVKLKN